MVELDSDPLVASLPLFKGSGWRATPFGVKVGRTIWTVATDGAYLMALKGKRKGIPTKDPDERVAEFVGAPIVKPAYGVEMDRLKEWAGPIPENRTFGDNADHQGVIFNVVVDRRRLACILENLPFGLVQVWNATKTIGVNGIGLGGKDFRAILAGLAGDPDPEDSVFPLRKSATEFDDAMELILEQGT